MEKNSLFNKWYWENETNIFKKMKVDQPSIRINSKWIKYLNVRLETIKLLEENIGSKVSDISHSNIFSDIFPQTRDTKERIHKWDYTKLKNVFICILFY